MRGAAGVAVVAGPAQEAGSARESQRRRRGVGVAKGGRGHRRKRKVIEKILIIRIADYSRIAPCLDFFDRDL
jgi:hypothetical protein